MKGRSSTPMRCRWRAASVRGCLTAKSGRGLRAEGSGLRRTFGRNTLGPDLFSEGGDQNKKYHNASRIIRTINSIWHRAASKHRLRRRTQHGHGYKQPGRRTWRMENGKRRIENGEWRVRQEHGFVRRELKIELSIREWLKKNFTPVRKTAPNRVR